MIFRQGLLLLPLLLSVLIAPNWSYPNGPPEDCGLTAPGHDGATAQQSPAPISIRVKRLSDGTTQRGVDKIRRRQQDREPTDPDQELKNQRRRDEALVRRPAGGSSQTPSESVAKNPERGTSSQKRRNRIEARKRLAEERRKLREQKKKEKLAAKGQAVVVENDNVNRDSRQVDGGDNSGPEEGLDVTWYRIVIKMNLSGDGQRRKGAKGILLRPSKGVEGTFKTWPERSYKSMEDGKCVSHLSPSYKRRAVFIFETPASAPSPTFEGILVGKDSQEWWTFDQKELEQQQEQGQE